MHLNDSILQKICKVDDCLDTFCADVAVSQREVCLYFLAACVGSPIVYGGHLSSITFSQTRNFGVRSFAQINISAQQPTVYSKRSREINRCARMPVRSFRVCWKGRGDTI